MGLNTKTVSADAISTSQNNYQPLVSTVATSGTFIRLNPTTALNITGLDVATVIGSGTSDGAVITLLNVGSGAVTFKHQNASSSAANRLITGNAGDLVVGVGQSVSFQYDPVATRWATTSATTALTGGAGTVGPGTTGAISKFTASSTIGDSIITESSGVVTVSGSLRVQQGDIYHKAPTTTTTSLYQEAENTGGGAYGLKSVGIAVWDSSTLWSGTKLGLDAGTVILQGRGDNTAGNVGIGVTSPASKLDWQCRHPSGPSSFWEK